MTPPWLAVQSIRLAYGRKTVVDQLSLALEAGSIGCLLGPSGCGKTSVLRAIAGFEAVTGGEIRLNGELVSGKGVHLPPEQRRIGMVFQDHALFPHLSVAANVGFGLRGVSDADTRVAEMLERVGLAHAAKRFPHELSGGQQQRVALARALAPNPALLLLDEPFSSLDVDLRERLGGELRSLLKAAGTTALLVTHDQHEAFAIADEIGVMAKGGIQQWASAYKLYHQPVNRFVADFVGQGAFLPGVVTDGLHVAMELGVVESDLPIRCTEHGDLCGSGCTVDCARTTSRTTTPAPSRRGCCTRRSAGRSSCTRSSSTAAAMCCRWCRHITTMSWVNVSASGWSSTTWWPIAARWQSTRHGCPIAPCHRPDAGRLPALALSHWRRGRP